MDVKAAQVGLYPNDTVRFFIELFCLVFLQFTSTISIRCYESYVSWADTPFQNLGWVSTTHKASEYWETHNYLTAYYLGNCPDMIGNCKRGAQINTPCLSCHVRLGRISLFFNTQETDLLRSVVSAVQLIRTAEAVRHREALWITLAAADPERSAQAVCFLAHLRCMSVDVLKDTGQVKHHHLLVCQKKAPSLLCLEIATFCPAWLINRGG